MTDAADPYTVPPADFVAARKALAAELRAAKDRDGAAAVMKLRKPSAAAAAVNGLVHGSPALVDAFRAAAAEARAAQTALVGGGDRDAWEAAIAALRAAQSALEDALGADPAAATRERVSATLTAAAADAGVERDALSGRLVRELQPGGFGVEAEDITLLPPRTPPAPARTTAKDESSHPVGHSSSLGAAEGPDGPAADAAVPVEDAHVAPAGADADATVAKGGAASATGAGDGPAPAAERGRAAAARERAAAAARAAALAEAEATLAEALEAEDEAAAEAERAATALREADVALERAQATQGDAAAAAGRAASAHAEATAAREAAEAAVAAAS